MSVVDSPRQRFFTGSCVSKCNVLLNNTSHNYCIPLNSLYEKQQQQHHDYIKKKNNVLQETDFTKKISSIHFPPKHPIMSETCNKTPCMFNYQPVRSTKPLTMPIEPFLHTTKRSSSARRHQSLNVTTTSLSSNVIKTEMNNNNRQKIKKFFLDETPSTFLSQRRSTFNSSQDVLINKNSMDCRYSTGSEKKNKHHDHHHSVFSYKDLQQPSELIHKNNKKKPNDCSSSSSSNSTLPLDQEKNYKFSYLKKKIPNIHNERGLRMTTLSLDTTYNNSHDPNPFYCYTSFKTLDNQEKIRNFQTSSIASLKEKKKNTTIITSGLNQRGRPTNVKEHSCKDNNQTSDSIVKTKNYFITSESTAIPCNSSQRQNSTLSTLKVTRPLEFNFETEKRCKLRQQLKTQSQQQTLLPPQKSLKSSSLNKTIITESSGIKKNFESCNLSSHIKDGDGDHKYQKTNSTLKLLSHFPETYSNHLEKITLNKNIKNYKNPIVNTKIYSNNIQHKLKSTMSPKTTDTMSSSSTLIPKIHNKGFQKIEKLSNTNNTELHETTTTTIHENMKNQQEIKDLHDITTLPKIILDDNLNLTHGSILLGRENNDQHENEILQQQKK